MLRHVSAVPATALIALCTVASAQAADEAAVIVTATRLEVRPEDAPGLVDVVGRREIRARNLQNIGEAVNTVPGVWVRPGRGVLDVQQTLVMHGIPDEKRNLVLVDGLPVNDAYSGSLILGGLPPELLQRVEVVQGPASALHGGNAMGGVVQFVTRMPAKEETEFKLGYGNPFRDGTGPEDTRRAYLSRGTRLDNGLALLAAASYRATAGYASEQVVVSNVPTAGLSGWTPMSSVTGATNYLIGDKGDNRWDDYTLHLKAEQAIDGKASLRLAFTRQAFDYRFGAPHTYLANAAGAAVWTYGTLKETSYLAPFGGLLRDTWQATLKTAAGSGDAQINIGVTDTPDNWFVSTQTGATRSGGPGRLTNARSRSLVADLQWTSRVNPTHALTLGGAYRRDQARNEETNLANWSQTGSRTTEFGLTAGKTATLGLFVQDEVALATDWTIFLGLRGDRWQTMDGEVNIVGTAGYPKAYGRRSATAWNPKAALVWRAHDSLSFKASLGRAFRPPTVYELYRTLITSSGTTYNPNPNLKPETVVSADVGIELKPWAGGAVKANLFENRMRDLVYTSGSGTVRDRINAGLAVSRGWTLGVDQMVGDWRLFANGTWTDATIRENALRPETIGKAMTMLPARMANIGVEGRTGPWTWTASGRYAGKQYLNDDNSDAVSGVYRSYDPYFIAETKLSYRVAQTTFSLSVDNLFDRRYYSNYLAPRRGWFAEVAFNY